MKDTFWTPELVAEFFNTTPEGFGDFTTAVVKFKSSKAPKKEWEIVAFKFEDRIYTLTNDGQYRDVSPAYSDGIAYFGLDYAFEHKNNCAIHSVRRLSDGEVFSVGDRLQNYTSPITEITTKGWVDGIGFNCGEYREGCSLSRAKKPPVPLFVTTDGVEIYPGMEFWVVGRDFDLSIFNPLKASEAERGAYKDATVFSTREAAETYILNNRPLLSLNDVKEALDKCLMFDPCEDVENYLTALVKQKLNP